MKKKQVYKIAKIAVLAYLIIGLILYFSQERIIFQGKKIAKEEAFRFPDQVFEEQNITRPDGSNLNFIKFKPADSTIAGIVIYFHGNRVNVTRYAPFIKIFTINGYEVWMMDYPGFGKSTGKLSESGIKADGQLIYNLARKKLRSDSILIYGKSLGTGVATYIASVNPCKRVLLETPYYSLSTVYDDYTFIYPTNWMLRFHFPSFEYMPKITAPITIFHGTNDELISYKNASRLKPLLKKTDEFITIEKARHNNIADYPVYVEKMDSILSL
jgi:fermentation-respiration switch protein FrsA (DUF1100 family)